MAKLFQRLNLVGGIYLEHGFGQKIRHVAELVPNDVARHRLEGRKAERGKGGRREGGEGRKEGRK